MSTKALRQLLEDVARGALLGLLETAKHGVLTQERCDAARAALAKAGVPIP